MANEALIDDRLKGALSALYRAKGRHYHGLPHVEALLGLARDYRDRLSDPEAVEAAIWFHDAVYDSRAGDNEAKSAELARERLAGRTGAERLDRIAAMILATADHEVPSLDTPGAIGDAALFLDMDLSILGAPPDTFEAYERAVRRDYGWVDDAAWQAGRAVVLKTFLARPHIFHSAEFRDRFEMQARANLQRSLAGLSSRDGI